MLSELENSIYIPLGRHHSRQPRTGVKQALPEAFSKLAAAGPQSGLVVGLNAPSARRQTNKGVHQLGALCISRYLAWKEQHQGQKEFEELREIGLTKLSKERFKDDRNAEQGLGVARM